MSIVYTYGTSNEDNNFINDTPNNISQTQYAYKKINELNRTTSLNDDTLLVTKTEIGEVDSAAVEYITNNCSLSDVANYIEASMDLGTLAYRSNITSAFIEDKLQFTQVEGLENLGELAYKDNIDVDKIIGQIPVDKLSGLKKYGTVNQVNSDDIIGKIPVNQINGLLKYGTVNQVNSDDIIGQIPVDKLSGLKKYGTIDNIISNDISTLPITKIENLNSTLINLENNIDSKISSVVVKPITDETKGEALATITVNDIETTIYGGTRNEQSGITNIGIGTILPFAGEGVIPENTLLCDGREVSRETYSYLFNVISTLYGEGDGSTTFNLPDLTNRFIEGCSAITDVGTYLSAGLPNVTGSITPAYELNGIKNPTGAFRVEDSGVNNESPGSSNTKGKTYTFDASRSNSIYGAADTVQPPAVMMRYVIVYTSLNGEIIVNGGNGVFLDGTTLVPTTSKTSNLTANNKTHVYTTQNDCYLVLRITEDSLGSDGNYVHIMLGDVIIATWGSYIDGASGGSCVSFPVKAGVNIYFKTNRVDAGFNWTVTEMKLS